MTHGKKNIRMKSYWSIPGPYEAPENEHCLAFYKYDGSNLRFEWSKKRGWYKYGTRRRLFDAADPEYGRAIELFQNRYADALHKTFTTHKDYKNRDQIVAFCEFYGEDSFAGYHNFDKPFEVMLIDIEIHKKGFVLPRQFVDDFSHVTKAPLVYEGPFNEYFIEGVQNNKLGYTLKEGVVAKGTITGRNPQHSLWFSKVKTNWWFEELKNKAQYIEGLKQVLEENQREQSVKKPQTNNS
jgi:hypothetical protein